MGEALVKIESIPDDPVALVHAMLRLFKHFDDREMKLTDLRIVLAALLGQRDHPNGVPVRKLAKWTGMTITEVENLIPAMLETRHLHEFVPTMGEFTYKLGQTGQTICNAARRDLEASRREQEDA